MHDYLQSLKQRSSFVVYDLYKHNDYFDTLYGITVIESKKVNLDDEGWYKLKNENPIIRPLAYGSRTWDPNDGKPDGFYLNVYGLYQILILIHV